LSPQIVECILQPAQPRQKAVELELQRRHPLARVEGQEQGDEADENDQEFHANRPSAARGACPIFTVAGSWHSKVSRT
jgi:hypothetical protein